MQISDLQWTMRVILFDTDGGTPKETMKFIFLIPQTNFLLNFQNNSLTI